MDRLASHHKPTFLCRESDGAAQHLLVFYLNDLGELGEGRPLWPLAIHDGMGGFADANGERLTALFTKAIELDPSFALAHGYAALCGGVRRTNHWRILDQADIAEIDRLARRAWSLDQEDAVAIGCAGHALCLAVHDLDSAATYIERALALNPNHAPNWIYSGWAHVFLGLNDVAMEHLSKAGRLSPFDWQSVRIGVAMTAAHYFAGRYEEACAWINRVLTDIDIPTALRFAAASAAMAGRADQAVTLRQRLQRADPEFRISSLKDVSGPYRNPEHPALFAEGLSKAGLPE